MCSQPNRIQDAITQALAGADGKRPVAAVIRRVCAALALSPRQVRKGIDRLVAAGELAYTSEFGTSFLVPSFLRPVRISERVVLRPANRAYRPAPGETVVAMKSGAAFGSGDHPTSRLGVRGIAFAVKTGGGRVLDIGTGSGILAITAVLLGMDSGIGTDIDPCALAEARTNVAVNGLDGRIRIEDRPWGMISERFSLVSANLRLPTLMGMQQDLARLCQADGSVVMTGFRPEEAPRLVQAYDDAGFVCRWRAEEGGWAGLVLGRA